MSCHHHVTWWSAKEKIAVWVFIKDGQMEEQTLWFLSSVLSGWETVKVQKGWSQPPSPLFFSNFWSSVKRPMTEEFFTLYRGRGRPSRHTVTIFFSEDPPSTISTGPLLIKPLPGLDWEALVGICCRVTDSRWCCYFHEIPQKPNEGAIRRARGAFITSTPTVFVSRPVSQKTTGRTPRMKNPSTTCLASALTVGQNPINDERKLTDALQCAPL